ncbi:MAG: phosphoglucosamine mutase [Holosporaceae bacterium]|nr:phosphoglucosamine mutase [Holosporaceae bacterium]
MRELFGTDGIRGVANEHPMTIEICQKLAEAIAVKFCSAGEKKHQILISQDTRISGEMFSHAMAVVFCSLGIDVRFLTVHTPQLSIFVPEYGASAGIMISASHNPYHDNGVKLFNEFGLKLADYEEEELEKILKEVPLLPRATGANIGIYRRHEKCDFYDKKIRESLVFDREFSKTLKVVVDCANGSLSQIAPRLLKEECGFDVVGLHCYPDGININEKCGVTHPHVIGEAVLQHRADVGIAFDGDGDRVLISDENGKILDGDHILAMMATFSKCKEVVSTIAANFALEKYLSSVGVKLVRTNVGDRYISEYMQKNDAEFGAEPSGHVIVKSHALTGDGLFAGLKVLEYMVRFRKKCSELRFFESYPTVNKNLKVRDKSIIHSQFAQRAIQEAEEQLAGRGKVIVRPSGTEPLIRISAEGKNPPELEDIVNKLSQVIGNLQ